MAVSNEGGLLESLGRLINTLLEIVQTRIELLSNEVEEEAWRVAQTLVLIMAAMMCLGLAVLMFSALLVALLWDSHPFAVLAGLGLLYLGLGTLAMRAVGAKMRERSSLFSDSIAELAKDRMHLGEGHERSPS